jgi:hypothetical protein
MCYSLHCERVDERQLSMSRGSRLAAMRGYSRCAKINSPTGVD